LNGFPAIEETRAAVQSLTAGVATKADLALQFACSVVVDVVGHGWKLKVGRGKVQIQTPSDEGAKPEEIKQRIRAGHLVRRDAQLREPAVAEFVRGMEQRRLGPAGWVSIFSLMRDGRDLAKKLSAGAGNQDQFPANRGFRAQAGCQRRQRRTKAGYGPTPKPP
jgi:hypothetical protein